MRERRGRDELEDLCSGPGKLTEALGVDLALNGADLLEPPFELSPQPSDWSRHRDRHLGPRIGITKAAELPWRYCAAGADTSRGPGRPRSRQPPLAAPVPPVDGAAGRRQPAAAAAAAGARAAGGRRRCRRPLRRAPPPPPPPTACRTAALRRRTLEPERGGRSSRTV